MDTNYKSLLGLIAAIILFCAAASLGYAQSDKPADNPFDISTDINADIKADTETAAMPQNVSEAVKFLDIIPQAVPSEIRPGAQGNIVVTFSVASGYYLYAEQTHVTPDAVPGLTFGEINKPAGTKKEDPYLGTVFMYQNETAVQLPVFVDKSIETGKKLIPLTVTYQGCSQKLCFIPQKKQINVELNVTGTPVAVSDQGQTDPVSSDSQKPATSIQQPVSGSQQPPSENPFQKTANRFGLLGVLAAAFIWGFLASLTPCVYPMIPVTISVIGSGSSGSALKGFVLSVFYVLGLSLTYAVFGTIAAWSGGLFGEYTGHPVVRIIVAGVFVILALSMFDLFYIQMPSAISSKIGGYSGSGALGVFLTGAVGGAVVGPCVGPMLVGLLLYIAAIGSKLQGFLIMWSFALGMGMLFLVIGTFSGVAASLPRAGMWMEKIKQFFGVLMLAVALYYIKPLMPENVFMLGLGIFLTGIGVFIGALDRLEKEPSRGDRFLKTAGIVFLTLGIAYIARFTFTDHMSQMPVTTPKAGITWLSDEASALEQAKQQNKLVMMDFSAEWCAVCKKLDRETFSHPEIIRMAKEFVCVRIDCTDAENPTVKHLQKKYRVIGLPTVIFMNSSGQVMADKSVTAFMKPDDLLKQMREIHVELQNR